jgi:IS4 transposase
VRLSDRLCYRRSNPYAKPLRLVIVRTDNSRLLTLLTNDMAADSEEIAALYKARWQVELFFKWVKQNLKLARFLGTSENAVMIQVLAALIAYLLLRLRHRRFGSPLSLSACASLIAATILQRRCLQALLRTPPPVPENRPQQFALAI